MERFYTPKKLAALSKSLESSPMTSPPKPDQNVDKQLKLEREQRGKFVDKSLNQSKNENKQQKDSDKSEQQQCIVNKL